MPTAHDHYREAERLLSDASFVVSATDPRPMTRGGLPMPADVHAGLLGRAQVHATLALAATNGADRAPADRLDTRTLSDPPAQGEPITDQMGETPTCADPECFQDAGHDAMPHVDSNGREYW